MIDVRARMHGAQPRQNLLFGVGVHRRQRIVQDQDPRVDRHGARQRGALLLPARQRDAALADHGRRSPSGKSATSLSSARHRGGLRCARRLPLGSVLLGSPAAPAIASTRIEAERDVVGQRVGEEERLLRHEADRAAEDRERDVAHVDAVDEDGAARRIVQPREQADERRLAGAGRADERDGLPRLDAQRDVIEHERRRRTRNARSRNSIVAADRLRSLNRGSGI